MELITRPLTKKEFLCMVENDEIPFVVIVDKRLIPTFGVGCDSDNDLTEKISEIVLGDTSGEIVCWNIVKEISEKLVEIKGIINVAYFLFGESSACDLIEHWEEECAAHLAYSNDKKDMYEGKW